MTAHIVTTTLTTLAFPTLAANDTVTITATGGLFVPGSGISGAGSNTVHIAGAVELDFISLVGEDYFGVSATGSFYSSTAAAALTTGTGTGFSVVNNAGSITSALGVAVFASGQFDAVVNAGHLSGNFGVQLGNYSSFGQTLANSGDIFGKSYGVYVTGASASLTNSGLIHAAQGAALSVGGDFNGVTNVATLQSVVNSGTISSTGTQALVISLTLANSVFLMQNTGSLLHAIDAIYSTGGSMDRIINSGTIAGAVSLGAGDDLYDGRGGDLLGGLFLGEGNDTADLRGGTLSGYVYGGEGSDVYFVSDSSTTIIETALDIDLVYAACTFRLAPNVEWLTLLDGGNYSGFGTAGANALNGNAGDNRLVGLDGLDSVNGGLGDDRINGGNQADVLNGDDGDDLLLGGTGTDTLRGGDGDDTVTGGADKDNLGGGTGADVFVFASLDHSATATGTWDTIIDFLHGDDRIDLSRIDANHTNAAANDTFAFIGTAAFSAVAGQVRYAVAAGYVLVQMDVNGDTVADSVIRLNGVAAMNANDFVL